MLCCLSRRRRSQHKELLHRVGILAFIILLSTHGILAIAQKRTAKATTKPGVVSGRVFAITGGGDVKPARMASVYLLYEYHGKMPGANKEYETTAGGQQFTEQEIKRLTEYTQWLEENGGETSESLQCRAELLSYDKRLAQIMNWAEAENKTWQVIVGQADEEGTFKLSVPHAGHYRLWIRGKAGFNEAFWNTDVVVDAGTETKVKLSAPLKACLEVE